MMCDDMYAYNIVYLFIHRVVSMGGCSLALTMVLYLTEALYFRSSTLNFYVIFPCVLNCKYILCHNVQFLIPFHIIMMEWNRVSR